MDLHDEAWNCMFHLQVEGPRKAQVEKMIVQFHADA